MITHTFFYPAKYTIFGRALCEIYIKGKEKLYAVANLGWSSTADTVRGRSFGGLLNPLTTINVCMRLSTCHTATFHASGWKDCMLLGVDDVAPLDDVARFPCCCS